MKTFLESNLSNSIFVDTNVIVDALTNRDYDYKPSQYLLRYISTGVIKACISSKQITDIYYILRKYVSDEIKKKEFIDHLFNIFYVLPLLPSYAKKSLNSPINDYEDAVIEKTAKIHSIKCLVTNNVKDFEKSDLLILTPEQFLTINMLK